MFLPREVGWEEQLDPSIAPALRRVQPKSRTLPVGPASYPPSPHLPAPGRSGRLIPPGVTRPATTDLSGVIRLDSARRPRAPSPGGSRLRLNPWLPVYLAAFLGSALVCAALTWLARAVGLHFGILDHPQGRKAHERPVPITGGWAVYVTFALVLLGGILIGPALASWVPSLPDPLPQYLRNLAGVRPQALAILAGATWIFLMGALDDVRPLGAGIKLVGQALAVIPILLAGVRINLFLPIPWLGALATVFWFVLLMNSFNFLDNMDGLCSTVAGTIAAVLAIAAVQGGQNWVPALFLCFSGSLLGFLFFNFHKASIFLGDSGALLIGYLLAGFSILITYYQPEHRSGLPVLIPVAVMGVPLFDTVSVVLIRLRNRKPIWVGDRNHFSHRLRDLGLSVRQTAVTIGVLTGAVGLLSLPLRYLEPAGAALHLLALLLLFIAIGALEFAGRKTKP